MMRSTISFLIANVCLAVSLCADYAEGPNESYDNSANGAYAQEGYWNHEMIDDRDFDPVRLGETGYMDGRQSCGGFLPNDSLDHLSYGPCCNCCMTGVFMPECPVLFKPLLADPRQIWYSVGWRFNDEVLVRNVIDVSFADTFPIYRWWNLFFCGDALQIELEGSLWAVFDPLNYSSPLVNADYYGGVPITYALGPLSLRLRFYHISSHIGDEFLLSHPYFVRLNPSAEYIDLIASYQITPTLRIYAGYGNIIQSDESYHFKPNYFDWGAEAYFQCLQFYSAHNCLSGQPYFAMHFRARQDNDYKEDGTYVLGYEFSKHSGLCRKWRIFMQYHQGFSCEGQFSRERTDYFAIRTSYWY